MRFLDFQHQELIGFASFWIIETSRPVRSMNSNALWSNNNSNGIGIVSALSSTPLASIPFRLRRNSINDLICGLTFLSPSFLPLSPLSFSFSPSHHHRHQSFLSLQIPNYTISILRTTFSLRFSFPRYPHHLFVSVSISCCLVLVDLRSWW